MKEYYPSLLNLFRRDVKKYRILQKKELSEAIRKKYDAQKRMKRAVLESLAGAKYHYKKLNQIINEKQDEIGQDEKSKLFELLGELRKSISSLSKPKTGLDENPYETQPKRLYDILTKMYESRIFSKKDLKEAYNVLQDSDFHLDRIKAFEARIANEEFLTQRNMIVKGNMRLILYSAKKFSNGLEIDVRKADILGAGSEALIEATERYNPTKGGGEEKFLQYATLSIIRAMYQEIKYSELKGWENDSSEKENAVKRRVISLDEEEGLKNGKKSKYFALQEKTPAEEVQIKIDAREMIEFEKLSEKERDTLKLNFGIFDSEEARNIAGYYNVREPFQAERPYGLQELAEIINSDRESLAYAKKMAIRKIKKNFSY